MTPKRKRSDTEVADPKDAASLSNVTTSISTECDSPRSSVAERFQTLDIAHHSSGETCRDQSPSAQIEGRKRQKRDRSARQSPPSTPTRDRNTREIAETPGARTKPSLSVAFASPKAEGQQSPPATPIASPTVSSPATRPKSQPVDLDQATEALSRASISPEATPSTAALTWQEKEITGHEIDPSADDDGEGINGIGFRPTAAMAEVRSMKRRQQVSEWRTREARDARQRRFEQRRASAGRVRGNGGQKRCVRFAD